MTDFLTADELSMIRSESKAVIEDEQMSVVIIYRRLIGSVFNPSTGTTTPTWTEITMRGFRTEFDFRDMAMSGGSIRVGDHMFLFDPVLLQAMPKPDDRVLEIVTKNGQVSLTNNSATLHGIGKTDFVQAGVQGGDIIRINGVDRLVKTTTDDRTLTVSVNYTGSNVLAANYVIYRSHEVVGHARSALRSVTRLQLRRAGG